MTHFSHNVNVLYNNCIIYAFAQITQPNVSFLVARPGLIDSCTGKVIPHYLDNSTIISLGERLIVGL